MREPTEAEREDARLEELDDRPVSRASRRCADCGVPLWGVCICRAEEDDDE